MGQVASLSPGPRATLCWGPPLPRGRSRVPQLSPVLTLGRPGSASTLTQAPRRPLPPDGGTEAGPRAAEWVSGGPWRPRTQTPKCKGIQLSSRRGPRKGGGGERPLGVQAALRHPWGGSGSSPGTPGPQPWPRATIQRLEMPLGRLSHSGGKWGHGGPPDPRGCRASYRLSSPEGKEIPVCPSPVPWAEPRSLSSIETPDLAPAPAALTRPCQDPGVQLRL